MPRVATFEPLISIPEAARRMGRSRSTAFRLLLRMYAADIEAHGECDWLVRRGRRQKFAVNLSRLRKSHPALFSTAYVDRDEYGELVERVKICEKADVDQTNRIRAVSGRVSRLERASGSQ